MVLGQMLIDMFHVQLQGRSDMNESVFKFSTHKISKMIKQTLLYFGVSFFSGTAKG